MYLYCPANIVFYRLYGIYSTEAPSKLEGIKERRMNYLSVYHLDEMAWSMMRMESGISTTRNTMLRMINIQVVLLVLLTLELVDNSPD